MIYYNRNNAIFVSFDNTQETRVATDASPMGCRSSLDTKTQRRRTTSGICIVYIIWNSTKLFKIIKRCIRNNIRYKKFNKYLYGRDFTIISDYEPLKIIFSPEKPIPILAAIQIQRWALTLSTYRYKIQHRKGKNMVVSDYLSRFAVSRSMAPNYYSIKSMIETDVLPLNY